MTIHRLYFGGLLTPGPSGNVWWQPSGILDSNDLVSQTQTLIFADTATKIVASCWIPVPKNYVGTAKIGIRWKCVPTSGDVRWNVDYRAIAVGESGDPSTWQESLAVTDTAAGTARLLNDAEVTLTAANLAVDDLLLIQIARDGTSGADTLAGSAELVEAWLEYADA